MSDLKEWIIRHLKNKDLVKKTILEITDDPDNKWDALIKRTNELQYLKITPTLSLPQAEGNIILVTTNTPDNLNTLIKDWKLYAAKQHLWIYFVNPQTQKFWALNPYTHDKISDKESLALGLRTMFESAQGKDTSMVERSLHSL
ncbi:hypothetical protein HY490_05550 [Candidatus Woesearchaeota archaeon]|nr:hypothetical protein [Candidatus Woesearchaeota archaeon]